MTSGVTTRSGAAKTMVQPTYAEVAGGSTAIDQDSVTQDQLIARLEAMIMRLEQSQQERDQKARQEQLENLHKMEERLYKLLQDQNQKSDERFGLQIQNLEEKMADQLNQQKQQHEETLAEEGPQIVNVNVSPQVPLPSDEDRPQDRIPEVEIVVRPQETPQMQQLDERHLQTRVKQESEKSENYFADLGLQLEAAATTQAIVPNEEVVLQTEVFSPLLLDQQPSLQTHIVDLNAQVHNIQIFDKDNVASFVSSKDIELNELEVIAAEHVNSARNQVPEAVMHCQRADRQVRDDLFLLLSGVLINRVSIMKLCYWEDICELFTKLYSCNKFSSAAIHSPAAILCSKTWAITFINFLNGKTLQSFSLNN